MGLRILEISPLFISAIIGLALTVYIARSRPVAGAQALIATILAATLWSLGYALEILAPSLDAKVFWAKFQYMGIVAIPIAWFIFVAQYAGSRLMTRILRYWALLGVIPVVTLILVWTNEIHRLVWSQLGLEPVGPFIMLKIEHGPWFWILLAFNYYLMFIGSIRLVVGLIESVQLQRWQVVLVMIAVLLPWTGNIIYATELGPIPHLDWTPFAFILAALFITISLIRFHLVNIIPIAQQTVFTGLPDLLLVLDLHNRIIDLNQVAQKTISMNGSTHVGKPLSQVLPMLATWVEQAGSADEYRAEICQGEGATQQFHDLRISTLRNQNAVPIGRLVVCHNITQHKQDQAELEKARAELEITVSERTESLRQALAEIQKSNDRMRDLALRVQEAQEFERRQIAAELHDRVGQNLTGLNLNLNILRNQSVPGAKTEVLNRLDKSLQMVEETTRQVRDVMADLNPPVLDEFGLVAAIQWLCSEFSNHTGIPAQVNGDWDLRLQASAEKVLFRLVQESLNNIAKHAQATQVVIRMESSEDACALVVEDNGLGFVPGKTNSVTSQPHWGLLTMQQRSASIGAQLVIDSAPGRGTRVSVRFQRGEHDH